MRYFCVASASGRIGYDATRFAPGGSGAFHRADHAACDCTDRDDCGDARSAGSRFHARWGKRPPHKQESGRRTAHGAPQATDYAAHCGSRNPLQFGRRIGRACGLRGGSAVARCDRNVDRRTVCCTEGSHARATGETHKESGDPPDATDPRRPARQIQKCFHVRPCASGLSPGRISLRSSRARDSEFRNRLFQRPNYFQWRFLYEIRCTSDAVREYIE